jgi:hypothetical protein
VQKVNRKGADTRTACKLFFCFLFISFFSKTFSQNKIDTVYVRDTVYIKEKKTAILSFGYGYPSYRQAFGYYKHGNHYYSNYNGFETNLGHLYLRGEWKSPQKKMSYGVNAFVGFMAYSYSPALGGGSGINGTTISGIGLGFRTNYYFKYTPKFQFYGALGVGFQLDEYPLANFYGEIFLGFRGALSKKMWLFSEVGIGKTLAQVGFSVKFNQNTDIASKNNIGRKRTEIIPDTTPQKKEIIISCGFGYPNFLSAYNYYANAGNTGSDYYIMNDLGTAFLKGEIYDPKKMIGLGATVFYAQQYYEYHQQTHFSNKVDTFDLKDIGVGFRMNLYMAHKKHFHSYLGLGVGGKIPLKTYSFPVFGELVLGFRYMPTKNSGIYLEIGPSKVLAQVGFLFSF